jgi:hypothetical protein
MFITGVNDIGDNLFTGVNICLFNGWLPQLSHYDMINLTLIFSARWGLKAATCARVASSCRRAV